MIFVGIGDRDGRFGACAELVEAVAERFASARETRPFQGHVTIGRCKGRGIDARAALEARSERRFGALAIEELHVYESQLGRIGSDGSTYVLRHRAPLGAN